MTLQEFIFKGETVEQAIAYALDTIGLNASETMIRIKQREGYSLFGYKEAIITVVFNQDESKKAIEHKTKTEFTEKFKMAYEYGEIKVLILSSF